MKRRDLLAAAATAEAPAAMSARVSAGPGPKTLRVVVPSAIFEPLLTYDPLARPAALVPLTAAALPEVSADFKRFVLTLQRGIRFADDPVFKGRPRELVAADYVHSFKRFYDPLERTEHLHRFENAKILGLSELRSRAQGQDALPLRRRGARPARGVRVRALW